MAYNVLEGPATFRIPVASAAIALMSTAWYSGRYRSVTGSRSSAATRALPFNEVN